MDIITARKQQESNTTNDSIEKFRKPWSYYARIIDGRGFEMLPGLRIQLSYEPRSLITTHRVLGSSGNAWAILGDKSGELFFLQFEKGLSQNPRWFSPIGDRVGAELVLEPRDADDVSGLRADPAGEPSSIDNLVFLPPADDCPGCLIVGQRRRSVLAFDVVRDEPEHLVLRRWQEPLFLGEDVRLLFGDGVRRELWISTEDANLHWYSLRGSPRQVSLQTEKRVITALAIDGLRNPESERDRLYFGDQTGEIRFIEAFNGSFVINDVGASLRAEPAAKMRGCVEHMVPLSDLTLAGDPNPAFDERGVIGRTDRSLFSVWQSDAGAEHQSMKRVIVVNGRILSTAVVPGDDHVTTVHSCSEEHFHLIRNPSQKQAPRPVENILDLELPKMKAPARAFAVSSLMTGRSGDDSPDSGITGWLVAGLGNHTVNVFRIWCWRKLRDACFQVFVQEQELELDPEDPSENDLVVLFGKLTKVAYANLRRPELKRALLEVWKRAVLRGGRLEPSRSLIDSAGLALYAVLLEADEDTCMLAIKTIRVCLRNVLGWRTFLTRLDWAVRKYHHDGDSYSLKWGRRVALIRYNAELNPWDAVIYLGLLAQHQVDVFAQYEHPLKEARAALPLPSVRDSEEVFVLAGTHHDTIVVADREGKIASLPLKGLVPVHRSPRNLYRSSDNLYFLLDEGLSAVSATQFDEWCRGALTGGRSGDSPPLMKQHDLEGGKSFPCGGGICAAPREGMQDHQRGEEFLIGDRSGGIWYFGGARLEQKLWLKPSMLELRAEEIPIEITVLRWLRHESKLYIAAGTSTGHVIICLWDPQALELTLEDSIQIYPGTAPVSTLIHSYIGDEGQYGDIVAGTEFADTAAFVTTLGILPSDKGRDRLVVRWVYPVEAAIRDLHLIERPRGQGKAVMIGSLDSHIHVLDADGRHLESVDMGRPISRFFIFDRPDVQEQLGDLAEAYERRCFVFGFDGSLQIVDLFNRDVVRELAMKHLYECEYPWNREPAAVESEKAARENLLRVAQSLRLRERFFKDACLLKSKERYSGVGDLLEELERVGDLVLRTEDESGPGAGPTVTRRELFDQYTGLVVAIYRRLFRQNEGEALSRRDHFKQVLRIQRELRERWDTPQSVNNIRIRLWFIRSVLRNLSSAALWDVWIQFPEGREWLLACLRSNSRFIQFKTVQYLHRSLRGWQQRGTEEDDPTAPVHGISSETAVNILDVLLIRVGERKEELLPPMNSIFVQIAILIRDLLRHAGLCPVLTLVMAREHGLDHNYMALLTDQFECRRPLREYDQWIARQLRLGCQIAKKVAVRNAHILDEVRDLLDDHGCTVHRGFLGEVSGEAECPYARNRQEAVVFYNQVFSRMLPDDSGFDKGTPIVDVDGLRGALQQLRNIEETGRADLFHSHYRNVHDWEDLIIDVIESFNTYRAEADDDVVDLGSLTPSSLARFQARLNALEDWIDADDPARKVSWYQRNLAGAVLDQWKRVQHHELDHGLIRDFHLAFSIWYQTVLKPEQEQVFQDAQLELEGVAMPWEPNPNALLEDYSRIFKNLFLRLSILASAHISLLLFRDRVEEEVRPLMLRLDEGGEALEWVANQSDMAFPRDLLQTQIFEAKPESELRRELSTMWSTAKLHVIAPLDHEGDRTVVMAFGWEVDQDPGINRLEHAISVPQTTLQTLVSMYELVELQLMQQRFFSEVAHNTRDPLMGATFPVRTIMEGWVQGDEMIAMATEAYRNLRSAYDAVLGLLSIRAKDRLQVRARKFNVVDHCESIVRTHRPQCGADKIQLHFKDHPGAESEWASCETDPDLFETVLNNLLTNARKFTVIRNGSNIHVKLSTTEKQLTVTVSDEGPGIKKNERREIFKPFFRSEETRDQTAGSGLGLTISRRIVRRLGGSIWVDSAQQKKGATMKFSIRRFLVEEESGKHSARRGGR